MLREVKESRLVFGKGKRELGRWEEVRLRRIVVGRRRVVREMGRNVGWVRRGLSIANVEGGRGERWVRGEV